MPNEDLNGIRARTTVDLRDEHGLAVVEPVIGGLDRDCLGVVDRRDAVPRRTARNELPKRHGMAREVGLPPRGIDTQLVKVRPGSVVGLRLSGSARAG